MAQDIAFTTLGELLDQPAGIEEDETVLERIKELAQEHLPEGWTHWEVTKLTKEEIFGQKVDANVLNKVIFALPTVGLVRAFFPNADHLSEKGYREIRIKLLDWAFTRALIIGPPAIANRIRGSASRTELFKQSVEVLRPLLHTRREVDKILSGRRSESEESSRRRRSNSKSSHSVEPPCRRRRVSTPQPSVSQSQDRRLEALEKRMDDIFVFLSKNMQSQSDDSDSEKENQDECSDGYEDSGSDNDTSWKAPVLQVDDDTHVEGELAFKPLTNEIDPLVPELSADLKEEAIECQRLGSQGWNRIRYKEVEKYLRAASVFSALKVNNELASLAVQSPEWLTKKEDMLGTITHGLLLQRKALTEKLNDIVKRCPEASAEIRALLAEDSKFKILSDQLLQYVCAHRAQVIEQRRAKYYSKNDILNRSLHGIPPSATHLFDESSLSNFIKDNGGVSRVFASFSSKPSFHTKPKYQPKFRKSDSTNKGKQPVWRTRPHSSSSKSTRASSNVGKQKQRKSDERRSKPSRKY